MRTLRWKHGAVAVAALGLSLGACGSGTENTATSIVEMAGNESEASEATTVAPVIDTTEAAADGAGASVDTSSFTIEVWADNWSAVYVNGELVGEDSVSITTERSFNAETFTFEAAYPFTLAVEAKDFKETDSGLEYIGEGNQQMGDGGLIAQITDAMTGEVVAYSDSSWSAEAVSPKDGYNEIA